MKAKSVAIIGAGVGGICAAIHLANQGMRVSVYEKNARPGGRCDRISRDDHHLDMGPTLLVMPRLYEAEFASMGVSINDLLDLIPVDPTYHLVFDDGSQLALTSDPSRLHDQLETIEPGAFQGYLRYHAQGKRHYDLGMAKIVNRDFRRFSDFFNLGNLPLMFQVKAFVNHYAEMTAYFKNPRLKSAFTFQDVYMGLSPFEAPATFSLMPYTELAHGVYYPKGGMFSIVEALMTLAQKAGVEFHFDTTVEKIQVDGHRATGLWLEHHTWLDVDVILANADLPYVYRDLLPDQDLAKKLYRKRYSCSVVSFLWGVDKPYPALGPHTLFLADDYRANFDSIERQHSLPENPSLYVHAPTRLDPSMAPPGEETIIAIVPVGHLSDAGDQDWDALSDQAREHVFRRLAMLGITDLQQHIKFETCMTPLSWHKRYNLAKGSTHGLSHNLTQLAYFRPANRHKKYGNLYFVGASTHPGTGIPTAMVSARLVSQRIQDEQVETD